LKRLVFVSLSLLALLVLIPGCITVSPPASWISPPAVQPPFIGTFSSSPSTINPGGTSTLSWDMTGANSVSIDNGIGQVAVVGTRVITPASSTTYTLTATNSSGTFTRSAMTTVNPPVWQPSTPSITPGNITVGIIPGESGSLVKSGQNYARLPAVCIGDTGGDLASRAFLSFDISSIPGNALIDEVSLNLGGYSSTGSPTSTDPVYGSQFGNFGAIKIERYQYGTYADLDTLAYNRPGELVASGEITSYPLSTWKLAIKDPVSGQLSVQGLVIAGQPRFQLRAQFFTSTNWNGTRDMMCFDQAMLTVKYHLP